MRAAWAAAAAHLIEVIVVSIEAIGQRSPNFVKMPRTLALICSNYQSSDAMMPTDEKHGRARVIATLLASVLTTLFELPPALAETHDASAQQEPIATQDTAEESDRRNNGSDITRPQTAFEIRGSNRTSSNDTSKTNAAQMLLRITSKIPARKTCAPAISAYGRAAEVCPPPTAWLSI